MEYTEARTYSYESVNNLDTRNSAIISVQCHVARPLSKRIAGKCTMKKNIIIINGVSKWCAEFYFEQSGRKFKSNSRLICIGFGNIIKTEVCYNFVHITSSILS